MLWIEFVNSLARDPLGKAEPEDRLLNEAWRFNFFKENELGDWTLGEDELEQLVDVRDLLTEIGRSAAESQLVTDDCLADLNTFLNDMDARVSITHAGDGFMLDVAPAHPVWQGIAFRMAYSCATFLEQGDLSRLRICENQDCGWLFYDQTRSRSKRWCADSCGNLVKVRRFRERQKSDAAGGDDDAS